MGTLFNFAQNSPLPEVASHLPRPRRDRSGTHAIGTTIAGRPPHRSVRAHLRIRLLPRMNGVEALIGIGVQNSGSYFCRIPNT
jgi:hypothetical protein